MMKNILKTAAAAALLMAAAVPPAHAGFWSSVGNYLSAPFRSAAPNHPSLRSYNTAVPGTTVVRTRVGGRIVYTTVPLTSSRAPSTGWNGYYDERRCNPDC